MASSAPANRNLRGEPVHSGSVWTTPRTLVSGRAKTPANMMGRALKKMSDVGVTSTGFDLTPAKILDYIKKSDLGLAIGIMAILVVLILPLPTWLLDVSLAFSLSFSILILMTAVFIRQPLEFSSFPTILL